MKKIFIFLFVSMPFFACSQEKESLKEKFADYFLIGATINQEDYQIIDKDEKILKIVSEDFNSVTPENSMKWMHSHPEYSKFTFSNAQKITDFWVAFVIPCTDFRSISVCIVCDLKYHSE